MKKVHPLRLPQASVLLRCCSVSIGLMISLALSFNAVAQTHFFYIPDQNAGHNTRAIALNTSVPGSAAQPYTTTQDDIGTQPNTNAGPYYTSTNVGVRPLSGAFVKSSFTSPAAASEIDVQNSCVRLNPGSGFQNQLNQNDDAIIQVVIHKLKPLTANVALRLKIYWVNANTATSATNIALPANLLIDANLGTMTSVAGDLPKGDWTYGNGSILNDTFEDVQNPTYGFKLTPVTVGDTYAKYIVFRCRWKAPATGDHYCLFAMLEEAAIPNNEGAWIWSQRDKVTSDSNHIAWRNLTLIDPDPKQGGAEQGEGGHGKGMQREIMIGNPSTQAEVMYFQWKPSPQFKQAAFADNFSFTLDLTSIPKDHWPGKDSLLRLNRDKRIEYDNEKGIITLSSPDIILPGIHFKPNEAFPLKVKLNVNKALAQDQYVAFSSVLEQYWVDKGGQKVLVGGQEILIANYAPDGKVVDPDQPVTAPDCTGLACWFHSFWFWLILVLILLGLILALRKKK